MIKIPIKVIVWYWQYKIENKNSSSWLLFYLRLLVWLEKGNITKGLEHILIRHEEDLKRKFGLRKEDIPSFVKDVFTNGTELSSKLKNGGYQKEYLYKGKHIIISGVGTNGFIVSIYPK